MERSNSQQTLGLSDSAVAAETSGRSTSSRRTKPVSAAEPVSVAGAERADARAALWKRSAANWRARFYAEKPLRDRLVDMLREANAEIDRLKRRLVDD